MAFLVFQLRAALAAWGDTAVGETRPTQDHPGLSALHGLIAAALGIRRSDEAALLALGQAYPLAVGVQQAGQGLRDYHTAQVPSEAALKRRPRATRRDELALPRGDLGTILSTREYLQGHACLVAVGTRPETLPPYSLDTLAAALKAPRYVLYLGRKACPPSAPLAPRVLEEATAKAAFDRYLADLQQRTDAINKKEHYPPRQLPLPDPVSRVYWSEGIETGYPPDLTLRRKDRLTSRARWQYQDRDEYLAYTEPPASR